MLSAGYGTPTTTPSRWWWVLDGVVLVAVVLALTPVLESTRQAWLSWGLPWLAARALVVTALALAPRPSPRRRAAGALAVGLAVGLAFASAAVAVVRRTDPSLGAEVLAPPITIGLACGGALVLAWWRDRRRGVS